MFERKLTKLAKISLQHTFFFLNHWNYKTLFTETLKHTAWKQKTSILWQFNSFNDRTWNKDNELKIA